MVPAAPLPPAQITLAVLAGGRGSRMGRPKGELCLFGQPILHYLLDCLHWPGPTLLVTGPSIEHPPGHARFTREIPDPVAGQGPLRGLLTALDALPDTGILLALTVDMPGLLPEHVHYLLNRIHKHPSHHGLLLRRGGLVEPFPSVYRKSAARTVRHRIESGDLSLRGLLGDPHFIAVAAPREWPESAWANLNSPKDVEAFHAS